MSFSSNLDQKIVQSLESKINAGNKFTTGVITACLSPSTHSKGVNYKAFQSTTRNCSPSLLLIIIKLTGISKVDTLMAHREHLLLFGMHGGNFMKGWFPNISITSHLKPIYSPRERKRWWGREAGKRLKHFKWERRALTNISLLRKRCENRCNWRRRKYHRIT